MTETALHAIGIEMGTDKAIAHAYTEAYERHLGHLRDRPITILEIGIGGYANVRRGGASLRMWKKYFPLAHVIGLDIQDKTQFAEERITILQGDQGDRAFLEDLATRYGPFDVVIDDGSHRCEHVIASFEALFPHVRDDGIYVVEDLQTSYWETYGGSSGADRRKTSMTFLQALVDGLNYAELDLPSYTPSYTDRWVRSMTFYHNIAFIQKGQNDEGSNRLPPHPRAERRYARRPRRTAALPRYSPRRLARAIVPLRIRRRLLDFARTGRTRARPSGSGKDR